MNTVVYRAKEGPYIEQRDTPFGEKYYLIAPAKCWYWGHALDEFPVVIGVSKDKNYLKRKMKKVLTQS